MAEPLGWYRDVRQPAAPARPGRWQGTRRQRIIDALACLALAAACFSQASRETLFSAGRGFYNLFPLGAPALAALVLNVVALAAAGFLAAQVIRRVRRAVWRRLAAVAAAATLVIVLNAARMTYEPVGRWADVLGRPGLLVIVALALMVSLSWPRLSLRAVRGIALVASPLAVITLAHALWMFLEVAAGPVWRRVDPAPLNVTAPSLRRVVWLVFEELDQALAFETRPAGLELPELDRLRRESVHAGAARPPGGTTEVSMPALITGRPVVAAVPVSASDLELTFADGKKALWSTHSNVFSRARALGYDTALIGWRLPYPRVLGGSLGAGAFRPAVAYEQTRGDTVGQALRNQWGSLVPPVHVRRISAQRFAELGELAVRAATDGRFGLVLLHLPLLQPQYVDNLVLADRVVGELRHRLERTRLLDRTWIVVTSDRRLGASKASDGPVDHRVPFLVRPPDGARPVHVDGAFNTLGTHDLVLAILRGSVGDTSSAAHWVRSYPSAPPRDYTRLGRPIY